MSLTLTRMMPTQKLTCFWWLPLLQSGDPGAWGGGGYVAHLQLASGGGQPQSLHNQVTTKLSDVMVMHQARLPGYPVTQPWNCCWPTCFFYCYTVSHRKVQTESSTGSVGSSRVRTTLTLCVETVDFDSQACQLRVKGTNIEENQYVKVRDV